MTDAYNNRGILRNRLGDYKNAIEDFNEAALRIKLDKAKVYYNRGISKLNLAILKELKRILGTQYRQIRGIPVPTATVDLSGMKGFPILRARSKIMIRLSSLIQQIRIHITTEEM